MAWHFPGGTIEAGQTLYWHLNWGGGGGDERPGVHFIQARPIPSNSGSIILRTRAALQTDNFVLIMELTGGYTYTFTVTNSGSFSTEYEIIGQLMS